MAKKSLKLPDEVVIQALSRAYADGRILLFTDPKTVARPGSPAYSEVDVFAPPLVLFVSSLTLLFTFGMLEWIVAMVGVLGYQMLAQPRIVLWRAHRRARRVAFAAAANLEALWKVGGIAVALKDWPERNCVAPGGDWRAFAIEYLVDPELLAEAGAGKPR